jgi:hypothetical protein
MIMKSRVLLIVATACLFVGASTVFEAQIDLCGCASVPDLQPFDSDNPATFPPGTFSSGTTLVLPLPPDGIFRFSSFRLRSRFTSFGRNAANTPVQILVSGNIELNGASCCYYLDVTGDAGAGGNSQAPGTGGLGGPGGFRGGDGASQPIAMTAIGGTGFGPGGGQGATPNPFVHGSGGIFFGLPELTPLVGGSGGGGGASSATSPSSCSAGGGGGGGGGLLVATNGTLSIVNYRMFSDGGAGAGSGNGACASSGGGGSAGAIRVIARSISPGPGAEFYARGGSGGLGGGNGRVRIETVDTSAMSQAITSSPAALRIVGPTPLVAPIVPTVSFTEVTLEGQSPIAVPVPPQGGYGSLDVTLPAPGLTTFLLSTSGVPSGTTILVTVKPRVGAAPTTVTIPVQNCNASGACSAAAQFTLPAGAYVAEARATFQVQ